MNLCQFEGSTSISSAELFGRPNAENVGIQAPDFDDVKESVRLGVTKVAGKISSLVNGAMSSIQVWFLKLVRDKSNVEYFGG